MLRFRSHTTGLTWPALPGPPGVSQLALLFQLEQTQWWSAEALVERQLEQFASVLRHAAECVPYYRERLSQCAPPRTLAELRQLPLLTRADVKRAGDALFSERVPADHGRVTRGVTSGSTGRPIEFRETQLTRLFTDAITLRDHFWRKRDFSRKLLAIRKMGASEQRSGWGTATDAAFQSGPCLLLDIRTDLSRQVDVLLDFQPEYVLSFPSNLHGLAQLCLRRDIRLPFLREVRAIGETLSREVRADCQRAFSAPVTDIYSASEAGYLALQCPEHERLHVQSECAIVEVLDAQGHACAPGEIGRVVVTPLTNFAMPLIRYEIGDYAVAGAQCECGRGLPVIESVVGRERNLVSLADGRRYRPATWYTQGVHIPAIEQFQLVQKSFTDVAAKLVTTRELTSEERQEFIAAVQRALGHPFSIAVEYCDSIARGAGGKFEDFICEAGAPLTQ